MKCGVLDAISFKSSSQHQLVFGQKGIGKVWTRKSWAKLIFSGSLGKATMDQDDESYDSGHLPFKFGLCSNIELKCLES